MKTTDFPKLLGNFLSIYLPSQRNLSKNTISSYCDTFRLLFKYCLSVKNTQPEKIRLDQIDSKFIKEFLDWLEQNRKSSISTPNQRLACIHSFFRYVQTEQPSLLFELQKILNLPYRKKLTPLICYLSADDLKLVLSMPNIHSKRGRRDLTLLSLLYDTGARVQELADLTPCRLRLEPPAQVTLVGKGNKARTIPLMTATVQLVKGYIKENGINLPEHSEYPLFFNPFRQALTRAGIAYILKKYVDKARNLKPSVPKNITPHILRHSKAMHLLEAGVNIVYIRDILGHVDVSTTEIYAKANMEMKRTALEKVSNVPIGNIPFWTNDTNLLEWLTTFGKSL